MKKLLSHITIISLAVAIALTSCSQKQDTEAVKEVPLKITYIIECSKHLLDVCDLVVTYKGDDGVNIIDTITANPADSTWMQTWTKTVGTHMIPVKIGLDYTFVQKADTLIAESKYASLTAKSTIIAEKIGIRKGVSMFSNSSISSKKTFYSDYMMMDENIFNTRRNLATIIDIYNDRQAYKRGTTDNKTCFIVKQHPYGQGMTVEKTSWND